MLTRDYNIYLRNVSFRFERASTTFPRGDSDTTSPSLQCRRGVLLIRFVISIVFAFAVILRGYGQDMKQIRRQDEATWAARTGLPKSVVHDLWRLASHFAVEDDDDSRIENLDVHGLASRNQVLMGFHRSRGRGGRLRFAATERKNAAQEQQASHTVAEEAGTLHAPTILA